jgi:hypothetical protein
MDAKRVSIYNANKLLCVLFCMWFSWPYATHKLGMYFGIVISILWVITTGQFMLFKRWSLDLMAVLVFFITLSPYLLTGEFKYSSLNTVSTLGTFYLFFLGIFIFHYYNFYKKDYYFLGKVATITIVFYFIGGIQTYIGLLNYPLASRILAQNTNPQAQEMFLSMGIGGFGYIYSAVFLIMMIAYPVIKQRKNITNRIIVLLWLTSFVLIGMIIKASYVFAIFMTVSGCILVLLVKNKTLLYSLLIFMNVFIILIPQHYIAGLFLNVAELFSNNVIVKERLVDFSTTLSGGYSISSLTFNRIDLYLSSLTTFFKYPFFGLNASFGDANSTIGNHSGWFDMMAYFGLFVVFPMFSSIWLSLKKTLRLHKRKNSFMHLLITYVFFIAYGFINPILYVYNIGLVVFLIVPSIPYIEDYLNGNCKNRVVNTFPDTC